MMVKANVTDLPVASGTRSDAAIVNDTPVTCPPSDPDGTPTLLKPFVVLTEMPVGLPDVAGPNVTPLRVSTCAPAAKLPSTRIVSKLSCIFLRFRPGVDPITDGQVPELEMKFHGYIKEIWSPAESAVTMVKANVTDLPVASGTRSDAAIANDTPVTRPPSDPDGNSTLLKSFVVLTEMP